MAAFAVAALTYPGGVHKPTVEATVAGISVERQRPASDLSTTSPASSAPTTTITEAKPAVPSAAAVAEPGLEVIPTSSQTTTSAPPPPPSTTTTTTAAPPVALTPPASTRAARAGDELLRELQIDLDRLLPGWTLDVLGPRTGFRGLTFPFEHRIEVYVQGDEPHDKLLHIVAHEIGHAVDVTYLTADERTMFQHARGTADLAWWVEAGGSDFASGAGDWAECYAWMTLHRGPWYSKLGGQPSAEIEQLMDQLITS